VGLGQNLSTSHPQQLVRLQETSGYTVVEK
jgi:hypothetical protein